MIPWLLAVMAIFGEAGDKPLKPDCLVIVAESSPIDSLSLNQLRGIYLKKLDRISRVRIVPVQLKAEHAFRKSFDAYVFGSGFDVENYWLEQRIQAGERPPIAVADFAYMILFVERNPGYIGYVPTSMRSELKKFKVKTVNVKGD